MEIEGRVLVLLGLSALASVTVIVMAWRREDRLSIRLATTALALIPVLGPLGALWVMSFPDRMHPNLRAKYKNVLNSYSVPKRDGGSDGQSSR